MTLPELIEMLTGMERSPGEADGLSELDHGLQCAYELSCLQPDDAELQVAGLVHDIGHQFASDEKIEPLIRAAQFHVATEHHRIVALYQRIQEFMD